MRCIYLVLSQTGTVLSRTIKFVTKKEYNHISLALDSSLVNMYSFGRKYPNNPFVGTFVIEGIDRGTFLKFYDTRCKVVCLSVSDDQYNKLLFNVNRMVDEKGRYKYNLIGLFMAAFGVHFSVQDKFYCSEFVRYILDLSDIDVSLIPSICHPVDFMVLSESVIYEGFLRDYCEGNF